MIYGLDVRRGGISSSFALRVDFLVFHKATRFLPVKLSAGQMVRCSSRMSKARSPTWSLCQIDKCASRLLLKMGCVRNKIRQRDPHHLAQFTRQDEALQLCDIHLMSLNEIIEAG